MKPPPSLSLVILALPGWPGCSDDSRPRQDTADVEDVANAAPNDVGPEEGVPDVSAPDAESTDADAAYPDVVICHPEPRVRPYCRLAWRGDHNPLLDGDVAGWPLESEEQAAPYLAKCEAFAPDAFDPPLDFSTEYVVAAGSDPVNILYSPSACCIRTTWLIQGVEMCSRGKDGDPSLMIRSESRCCGASMSTPEDACPGLKSDVFISYVRVPNGYDFISQPLAVTPPEGDPLCEEWGWVDDPWPASDLGPSPPK